MAWENRKSHRYSYLAKPIGGRVVKTYVGVGADVEKQLKLRANERFLASLDREDQQTEASRAAKTEQQTRSVLARIQTSADKAMVRAGYHQHKGQWRRRRGDIVTRTIARRATC